MDGVVSLMLKSKHFASIYAQIQTIYYYYEIRYISQQQRRKLIKLPLVSIHFFKEPKIFWLTGSIKPEVVSGAWSQPYLAFSTWLKVSTIEHG